ncbi:UNVERIFIED_CONTAM: hypothetical protein Sindi_1676200 [Sesamum indicum]
MIKSFKSSWDSMKCMIMSEDKFLQWNPLPDINKAYAIVLRVEKQKEVNSRQQYSVPNVAMQAFKRLETQKPFQNKKTTVDERNEIYKECGKSGHLKEVCFEIHGYPDWYKNLLQQRKKTMSNNARAATISDLNESANNVVDSNVIAQVYLVTLYV